MPDNKPFVLFLPGWYPNRNNPNLGNFNQRHAEAINKACNISVLSIAKDGNLMNNKIELVDEIVNGVKTVYVYYGKKASIIAQIHGFITGWKYIIARSGKPEVVHVSITYPAGFFALWIKIFFKIPYVISEHWSSYMPRNRHKLAWHKRIISKIIFRNASMVMPVSKSLQDGIKQGYAPKAKFSIVPNTVDVSVFSFSDDKLVSNKKQILHVSTLNEEAKNVFGLLRAVKNLSLKRNDFELHIIHEYYSKRHEDYARELGLLDTFVFFKGDKTMEEVAEAMRNADFFVLFSNYESMPVVLIESLACGLPVLTTDVGGIPEFIKNDFGILIKPKDEAGLLNAMQSMLDRSKDYDKNMLREYASENFSFEVVGKMFLNIYNQVKHRV